MLKNKHLLLLLLLFFLLLLSIFWFKNQKQTEDKESMLLYTLGNKDSYILNINTGKIAEVASGLAGVAWSPSGEKILFRSGSDKEKTDGLWISDSDGSNLHQVFSMASYPEMKIFRSLWLTNDTVLINLINTHNIFLYQLEVNTMDLISLDKDVRIDFVSPDGKFWIQSRFKESGNSVEIASLEGVHTSINDVRYNYLSGNKPDATYSPDGVHLVYPAITAIANNTGDLWIVDINQDDFSNLHYFASVGKGHVIYNWAPNGEMLGVLKDNIFILLDGKTGALLKEFHVNGRYSNFWWSPDSGSIITDDIGNIWLTNIETGESTSILSNETTGSSIPIIIKDWRLIPVP